MKIKEKGEILKMLKLSPNALGMLIAKYKSVLKNMFLKNSVALALCASLFCAAPVWAEDITYTGNKSDLKIGTIGGSDTSPGSVFSTSSASGNNVTVNFTAGTNPYRIFGGLSDSANVTGNTVYFRSGTVDNRVYGGYALGVFDATGNSVSIFGGGMGTVYGGFNTSTGNANYNSVTISGGTVTYGVTGGYSDSGSATANSVTISGDSKVGTSVVGGYSASGSTGDTNYNSVTIFGDGMVDNDATGGFNTGTGNTTYNSVSISGGGRVNGKVYGGYSRNGNATHNSVHIFGSGQVLENVWGGYGGDGDGTVTDNSVIISGNSTVGKNVYGGVNSNGAATGNSIAISGSSTIVGDVYGGLSEENDATGNSITISGNPTLTNSKLYGGFKNAGLGDAFTGNTLNINTYSGTVTGVYNFQNYNFLLSPNIANNDSVLSVTGTANLTDGGNSNQGVASSVIKNINILGGGRVQQVGESFTLIDADTLVTNGLNNTVQGLKGVSLLYNYSLDVIDNKKITATVTGTKANPQAKSLSEGRAAGMGFLNQGADLVTGKGMSDALLKTKEAKDGKEVFGAMSYGSYRYQTGSHADVNGVSLLAGLAARSDSANGSLVRGIFLEGGRGSYDGYNSFTAAPSVRSDGNVSYFGLGALVRRDMTSGKYLEGSLRGGKSRTTFNSSDFTGAGQNISYTSKPAYYGAHIGIGRAKMSGDKTVDYYAKYFWTHQNGDDVNILGDTFNFSASDSHRLRGGVRLTKEKPGGRIATYAGLAYEYEFDGKANATVYGYDIDAPNLRGGTGIVELGMSYKTHTESMNTLHLSLQGYAGKRQGLSGSVQFKRVF